MRSKIQQNVFDVYYALRERPLQSAMAVPIDSQSSYPTGAIYISSAEPEAFNADDMLLTRLVGRMVGELLTSYQAQKQLTDGLTTVLQNPETMDDFFQDLPRFGTENAFVRELEALTAQLRAS